MVGMLCFKFKLKFKKKKKVFFQFLSYFEKKQLLISHTCNRLGRLHWKCNRLQITSYPI